jgi:D-glycero-D-manno-heptose 1,7-bisphosphate phosphatase
MGIHCLKPAAFFDRDGTLVKTFPEGDTTRGPRTCDEIEFLPGVRDACTILRKAGFRLVLITNQPDISRGIITPHSVHAVNTDILYALALHAVYFCPHQDSDRCSCRKPQPGLIYAAAYEMGLCLQDSFVVGDRPSDIEAAVNAGCRHALVTPTNPLLEIAKWICRT